MINLLTQEVGAHHVFDDECHEKDDTQVDGCDVYVSYVSVEYWGVFVCEPEGAEKKCQQGATKDGLVLWLYSAPRESGEQGDDAEDDDGGVPSSVFRCRFIADMCEFFVSSVVYL